MSLPKQIDPVKFARTQTHLQGDWRLSSCPRLQALVDQDGCATVDLRFKQDESYRYIIVGRLQADVKVSCRRCDHPVTIHIDTDVSLSSVLTDAQAKNLPAEYEPLVTGGDPVSLGVLIEDELFLALPMVPKHEVGQCPADFPEYLNQC